MNDRTLPRWLGPAALAAALVALVAGSTTEPVDAQSAFSQFEVVASAEGSRYAAESPGAPLTDQLADAGSPIAQSVLNNLGESQSFASAAYPGETVLTFPTLAAGAAGAPAPPPYPLIVSTSHPTTADASAEQGPTALESHSDGESTSARATSGAEQGGAGRLRAQSSAELVGGVLRAQATSTSEGFDAGGGLLRIGRVIGTAEASVDGSGALSKASDLVVEGVTVAGMAAEITADGVVFAGSTLPTASLSDALTASGIQVRLVEPLETERGVVSGAVVITSTQPGPTGPVTQTVVLGRASAAAVGRPATVRAPSAVVPPPAAPTPAAQAPAIAPSTPPAATVGGATPAAPTVAAAPATPAAPVATAAVRPGAFPFTDGFVFYIAIVLAALVTFGAGQLVRIMGVKAAWTS